MDKPAKGQWWKWTTNTYRHKDWHDAFQLGDRYIDAGWKVEGRPDVWVGDSAFYDGVTMVRLPDQPFTDERNLAGGLVAGQVMNPPDIINDPPHYKSGGMEAVDVIEAFKLDWHLGSAAKYLLRAGRKGDALEDLLKCKWFLERKIAQLGNK